MDAASIVVMSIVFALSQVQQAVTLDLSEVYRRGLSEAYERLKEWIAERYPGVSLSDLENSPHSADQQCRLRDALTAAGAGDDEALVSMAKAVTAKAESTAEEAPENFSASGDFDGASSDEEAEEPAQRRLPRLRRSSRRGTKPTSGRVRTAPPSYGRPIVSRGPSAETSLGFIAIAAGEAQKASGVAAGPSEASVTRTIDAHLLCSRFAAGQIASLTVTLRLPGRQPLGQFQGSAGLQPGRRVHIALEVRGFTLLSEPPGPITLDAERDSAPAAFQLRIEEATDRWIHVLLLQDGHVAGELAIGDFSALEAEDRRTTAPMRQVQNADLTIVVRTDASGAVVSSPRDRASLDYEDIAGIEPLATPFQVMLRDRLRALYDDSADPATTARELQIVGVELARCLSPALVALLRRPDIRTVMLRHDEAFDFPIELCFLDDATDPFFVGDRIAVCRWYLGVTNPPDVVAKRIGRVAFLRGNDAAAGADEATLEKLYPGRLTTLASSSAVRDQLFKRDVFDLIQFTGHCQITDKGLGGLVMQDASCIRMIDIGQLMTERVFCKAQPFVLLNACASAQPYVGLTTRDSFAHRFVTAQACAFIGTLWPVAGAVANDFAAALHEALRTKTVGDALLSAKLAVFAKATDRTEAGSDIAAIARQVAARSYCLFAHPDLQIAV